MTATAGRHPAEGPWSTLDVRVDAPVAWVRFDRPAARNGVNLEMMADMHAALTALSVDDALSVVVLTGTGSMFCPGADLGQTSSASVAVASAAAEPEPGPGPSDGTELPPLAAYQSATLLHEMPQLTLAAVNGGCAGAGFAWALACDLRVATARARFSPAILQLGLASELGLPWTLARAVGGAVARDLCFLPRRFTADEARGLGLVSRVFPDDDFADAVAAIVAELGSRGLRAVRTLKANFLLAERGDLAGYVDAEARRHQEFFVGAARAETMRALRRQGSQIREERRGGTRGEAERARP